MRSVLTLAIGLTFTALVLILPALHVASWSGTGLGTWTMLLIAIPVAELLACTLASPAWLKLIAFPVSHLPAIIADERLAGRLVYDGLGGLFALLAVALSGLAWYVIALWPPEERLPAVRSARAFRPGPRTTLHLIALAVALAIYGAFVAAAFRDPFRDPLASSLTLVAGVGVVWYGVGHLLVGQLGDLALEQRARQRLLAELLLERAPSRPDLVGSVVLALLALALLTGWYFA